MNPLLDFTGLPGYDKIEPAHVGPAIDGLLAEAREAVKHAERADATWKTFVEPLDDANERVAREDDRQPRANAARGQPLHRGLYGGEQLRGQCLAV